jgi:ParB family chromosome partitioning protein
MGKSKVVHKVHDSLKGMLVPIVDLQPLESNPRIGNVEAIASSYNEFGQLKPIVVRLNDDGPATVIAGNHQVEAAKRLGWTHIAALPLDADDKKAIAFALADNRTMELGHTDNDMALGMIVEVMDDYGDLIEGLGWDDFEIALYEEHAEVSGSGDGEAGFISPVLISRDEQEAALLGDLVREDEDGERHIVADDAVDHEEVAIQGSTVTAAGAAPQAVVQYTLVFDDPDQQKRWYDFVKWLRNQPSYEGDTTAQKLISFIDSHSEV